MKKLFLSLITLVAFCSAVNAATDTISQYMVRQIAIPNLILTDSIDPLGKPIDRTTLLKTSVNTSFADCQHQTTDGATLPISKPATGNSLHIAGFNLTADRYTDATLNITTTAPAEIYVDDCLVKSKTDKEATATTSLTLEPMRLYHVAIKLLTSTTDTANVTLTSAIEKSTEKAVITATTNEDRVYLLTDNFIGTRVTNVTISPCGKYVLTSYSARTNTKMSTSYSILTDAKTGKQIAPRFTETVRWMPTSSKLYFTTTATTGHDIYTYNPLTFQTELFAAHAPTASFVFSPTEDFIIYDIEESAQPQSAGPLKYHASVMDRCDGRGRRHLALYNFATASATRLTAGNHSAHLHDISRDGSRILFATYTTDYSHRQQTSIDLYQLNLRTMAIDTLFANQWFFGSAAYSPNGTQLLLIAGPEAFGGIGLNCGNHPIANDYDTQAFIYDFSTKNIQCITRDFDPTVSLIDWNLNGNIYLSATEKSVINVYEYRPTTRSLTRINSATEMTRSFSLSNDGRMAVYKGIGQNHSTRAYLYDTKKGNSTLIADPMADTYSHIALGNVEDFVFTYDSTDIDGWICYPPHFDASKKYPMIVYYYGGTTPSQRWNEYYYGAHLFASRGYIVYVVNPSGTIGYGQEFSARHVNAWGRRTADEIIRGTQLVCQSHPAVDASRIGCIGASYGGFMTEYLQTLTDIFACAVSHAGISNVTSYWGEGYWGVGYNTIAAAGSYPWTDPDLFTRQGALFNADKINTPLLLLHGGVDTNVPKGESIQLFNALKIQNKIVEFVEVEGENHTIVRDLDKQTLWHNTYMAWFARWLQDAPEWWDALYPKIQVE